MKRAIKIFLICASLCTFLGCQSFKNRAPQSAGFGGYCPECLVKNIDKDLSQLQNVVKVANKAAVYTISGNSKCAKGYVDGKLSFGLDWSWSKKKCLKENTLPVKYETDLYSECAKSFVEGRKFKSVPYHYKECLNKNNLDNKYKTSVHTLCIEGYVDGRWFKRDNHGHGKRLFYRYKKCLKESTLPAKYNTSTQCAEGYITGKQFQKTMSSSSYKECIKQ